MNATIENRFISGAEFWNNNETTKKECVLLKLPQTVADIITSYQDGIPQDWLYITPETSMGSGGFGLERDPHITVLWGLQPGSLARAKEVLTEFGPISARLGYTSVFENPEYDVLKFDVDSADLARANAMLRKYCSYENDFPVYHPHVTIAYLKKGKGKDLVGSSYLSEMQLVATSLLYSDVDHIKTVIPLE